MYLPINNICHSHVNGPGNRLVIWVQGCKFNCKGCFNPETHPYTKENLVEVIDLVKMVNEDVDIEGITISGGEPLDYPNQIQSLLTGIEKRITTIIYSGYHYEEVISNEDLLKVIKFVDLSIIGRFDLSLPHPYLGKKFVLTSDRIDIDYFKPKQLVEYVISKEIITKTGIFK
jgi:anaerobic ribonucleoside-triphosphate reductase activating protein